MGDLVGPVIENFKCIGAPIVNCGKNHVKLDDYMKELTEKQAKLNSQETNIKQELDAQLRVQKVPKETPSSGLKLPTKELVGQIEAKDKILSYLRGDEVAKIGVHGLGGAGKTAIMKHVNNQLLIEAKFDYVFWVTVTEDHDECGIQSAIAELLDESITASDETIRRGQMMRILEDKKKFVLILDGMWKQFDLERIGISDSLLNNERKLVLTTRKKKVCESIGCTTVEVTTLPVKEAESLFSKKVGFDIFNDPDLESIANHVLGKCGGLPLAISVVGEAMRNVRSIERWRSALDELTQGNWSNLEHKVLKVLKISYDNLEDEEVQQCFLYCSRYPEDKEIPKKELIDDWISERYVNEKDRSKEKDKVYAILSELENNGLLEKYGDGGTSVKMHPLIRHMALYVKRCLPPVEVTPVPVKYSDFFKHLLATWGL